MTSSLTNILQVFGITPTSATKSISNSTSNKTNGLREIFLQEVANHDSYDDCWIVIYDRVYDVTKFLREHPGGDDIIIEHAGRDATLAFHGTGHSRDAIEMMRDYLIGELPAQQRIFRTETSQVLLRGIPE